MPIHKIPIERLSLEVLRVVIEEFISREGTDYGERKVPLDTMVSHVKQKLETGLAVLIFDDETETPSVLLATNPILKKLDASND